MNHTFFATLSRMKYIDRWALMRNSRRENLSEHCLEVAMIAHALCTIGNVRYGHGCIPKQLFGVFHPDSGEQLNEGLPRHLLDEAGGVFRGVVEFRGHTA